MQDFLNHPAVQAGLAPFLAALVTAALFRFVKLSGLSIIAGFAATVYLASGFDFEPLTASRKIVLLGLLSILPALLIDLVRFRWLAMLLPIFGGAAAIWTAQRMLQQQAPEVALLWGTGSAAYVAVLVWGMDKLENSSPRAASAATALGIGTGGAALVGASALLGQFGLALGAAAGAFVLIQMITNQTIQAGRMFTLPAALIAGLTGCVAVLSARLPWYALAILACIPVVVRLVPIPFLAVRIQSLLLTLLATLISSGAIYITWRAAGDIPF